MFERGALIEDSGTGKVWDVELSAGENADGSRARTGDLVFEGGAGSGLRLARGSVRGVAAGDVVLSDGTALSSVTGDVDVEAGGDVIFEAGRTLGVDTLIESGSGDVRVVAEGSVLLQRTPGKRRQRRDPHPGSARQRRRGARHEDRRRRRAGVGEGRRRGRRRRQSLGRARAELPGERAGAPGPRHPGGPRLRPAARREPEQRGHEQLRQRRRGWHPRHRDRGRWERRGDRRRGREDPRDAAGALGRDGGGHRHQLRRRAHRRLRRAGLLRRRDGSFPHPFRGRRRCRTPPRTG